MRPNYKHSFKNALPVTGLGYFIQKCRLLAGMPQIELARKLDISREYLSSIENGRKHLPVEKLELLSNILQLDIAQIKTQFYSDLFTREILASHCPETVLEETRKKLKIAHLKLFKGENGL